MDNKTAEVILKNQKVIMESIIYMLNGGQKLSEELVYDLKEGIYETQDELKRKIYQE